MKQPLKRTVTKNDLVIQIAQESLIHPNKVRRVVQAFLNKLIESLAREDRLEFRDFGVFDVVRRKQKVGRNPKNASVPIVIPPRNTVKFTPGKKMRKMVERELSA